VIAHGTAFVSVLENKSVSALDVKSGAVKWTKHFPARVDAPPSMYKSLALVGCSDGWVYALRADNGGQVYRLRIAPAERRIVAYGQLESAWPVVGGVLLVGDMAYAVAGRTTEVDGGLYVVGFDAQSGKVVWEGRRHLNNPGDIGAADHNRYKNEGTGAADILSSDGKLIVIGARTRGRKMCFDAKTGKGGGKYTAIPYRTPLQSTRDRSVVSIVNRKTFTAVSPSYHKKKRDEVAAKLNKPGSLLLKGGWKLTTGVANAVAISAGADRLAVAIAKEGKNELWIVSCSDGKKLAAYPLPSAPTEDGIAITNEVVLVTLEDGSVVCFGKK
jgi:outer membrane protein assembly factor BamB